MNGYRLVRPARLEQLARHVDRSVDRNHLSSFIHHSTDAV